MKRGFNRIVAALNLGDLCRVLAAEYREAKGGVNLTGQERRRGYDRNDPAAVTAAAQWERGERPISGPVALAIKFLAEKK